MTCPFPDLGCSELGKLPKGRSPDQHRRFFGLIKAAFENWPEAETFQPATPLHLRKWAAVKAGWFYIVSNENPNYARQAAEFAMQVLRQHNEPGWIVERRGQIALVSARSISYKDMSHQNACRVFSAAEDILCEILGFPNGDALLEAAKQARAA